MKIAFLNRAPDAYPGGDVLSVNDTIAALSRIGIEAKYVHGHWKPADLQPYDLVHIRHVNFGWSVFNFRQTYESGKPFVVTTCYYPRTDLGATISDMREAFHRAKAVVTFSAVERDVLKSAGLTHPTMHTIPNGTDPKFHAGNGEGERTGVLAVSARSGGKDNDRVMKSASRLRVSYTEITGKPPQELIAAYRSAKVFVNASSLDQMSRSVGEALCSGCRVVVTKHNWGNRWYGAGLATVDSENEEELDGAILRAMTAEEWDWRPNTAARKLTWDVVAAKLKAVYEEALG